MQHLIISFYFIKKGVDHFFSLFVQKLYRNADTL